MKSLSPGLRAASYPGLAMGWGVNSERVASLVPVTAHTDNENCYGTAGFPCALAVPQSSLELHDMKPKVEMPILSATGIHSVQMAAYANGLS